jgi:YVTN family beta-propeller protein
MSVRIRFLGTLEVEEGGRPLSIGSGRQRAVLLVLALHAGEVVSAERLIEELWAGRPPASAAKVVQGYVSQLRRVLPAGTIVTRGSGYLLEAGETDAMEFERLHREAAAQETARAAGTLRRALGLWRGKPLADVEYEEWAQAEIRRLESLRLTVVEQRIEADLELGRHARLVPELEALVAEQPLREGLRAQLMIALYRSGRQADALAVYRHGKQQLDDGLGLEPSPFLDDLERRILTHDEALGAVAPQQLPSGTVTLLFTDIEGSTRLLKQLGDRYAEVLAGTASILRGAAEGHGGHEVDNQGDSFFFAFARAKAALASAVVAQRELAAHAWPQGVEVRVRMGLHTGEPLVGEQRYIGLGVHRAARIGAIAHGGQVLLSNATRELVEDEVDGVTVRALGAYRLKDIDRPEPLFQLDIDGLEKDFPPLKAEQVLPEDKRPLRRRTLLLAALAGALAAAVAVPLFAFSGGGSPAAHAVAAVHANSVAAVPAATGRLSGSVSLGGSPNAIASGADSLWVSMPDQDSVSRIDPTTNTVQQTIPVGSGPAGIAFGGGFVWVADSLAGTVTQIDPRKNGGTVVDTITVGNGPSGIAYGQGAVWVANSIDRSVVRIDPLTGKTSAPIPVDDGADALAAGSGGVWVVGEAAGVLSRLDPAAGRVIQTINVGREPSSVAVGHGNVWVTNSEDGTVSRIRSSDGRPDGLVDVGDDPGGVAVGADGKVWVSNDLSGTLSRIDSASGTVAATTELGALPQGVALSGKTVYVAVQGAEGAHRGGTLTVVISNPAGVYAAPIPKLLDPAAGDAAWELLTLTNDGLLAYGRTGGAAGYKVVPDLAVSPPTVGDGGLTYSFQLRPGVRYSTGAEVRPADIRRGIARALAASHGEPPGSYLSAIVGAEACMKLPARCDLSRGVVVTPHSNVITFHLTIPDPDFLYQLALPTFDAVPAATPLAARLPLPATGPYRVATYQAKPGVIRLVRNPHFRVWSAAAQPDGYPDAIVERYGYTAAAAVHAVERGVADITTDGLDQTWSPALAASLETRYSSRLYTEPLFATLGLWMNTKVPPFNDVRVRRALNFAVDRNHLVEMNGGPIEAGVSCQILTPNTNGYSRYCPYTSSPDEAGAYSGPDLAKARRLVAASGTRGQRVDVWFFDIPIGRENGAYFVSVLRSLGYRAQLKTVPHDGEQTWRAGRQDGVGGWGPDYPSPTNVFGTFACAADLPDATFNPNPAALCDRRVDAQVRRAAALASRNPAAAAAVWRTIDRELTDDAPWVPMKVALSADFVSNRVGNYTYCWLSGWTGLVSACLDQLWVR